jgi:hypothetical protein
MRSGEATLFLPALPRACRDKLFSRERHVEPLRFTTRGITRVTFVKAAEPVRRQCLARTPLADFFNILLVALPRYQMHRTRLDRGHHGNAG